MLDTIIKGGTIIDGTGGAAFSGDISIKDGTIRAVGAVGEPAAETIDADGLTVTPGFVDIHTHYDGQATWDSQLTPSSWHGVTTVAMGNCGVGFAPVRERDRDWLIRLMEGVEDIPGTALHEGIDWQWETFPEYLDLLGSRSYAMDIAAQIPHGPLRTYVMGERGAVHSERPTAGEIAKMGELVKQALQAGAFGFSTSRTAVHQTSDGQPTPSLTASEEELLGIAAAMREAGTGLIEIVSDYDPVENEFALIRRLAEVSERPVSVAVTQDNERPGDWRRLLDLIGRARQEGVDMHGQVTARPISVLLGLSGHAHFLMASSAYHELTGQPLSQRVEAMRAPEVKQRVLEALDLSLLPAILHDWEHLFPFDSSLNYFPTASQSVGALARERGLEPVSLAYDLLLAEDGRAFLYMPARNYATCDDGVVRSMLGSEHTILGLGDAGAHCGLLCDASMPTFLLTHWCGASAGEFPIEWAVHRLTRRNALAWGLEDRGLIAPGMKADLNLIDRSRLRLLPPRMVNDLPAQGARLLQEAEGYVMTILNGEATMQRGESTGQLPGRLLRARAS